MFIGGGLVPDLDADELLSLRKEKFGGVFKDGALFTSMSVLDNVAFVPAGSVTASHERVLRDRTDHERIAAGKLLKPTPQLVASGDRDCCP